MATSTRSTGDLLDDLDRLADQERKLAELAGQKAPLCTTRTEQHQLTVTLLYHQRLSDRLREAASTIRRLTM